MVTQGRGSAGSLGKQVYRCRAVSANATLADRISIKKKVTYHITRRGEKNLEGGKEKKKGRGYDGVDYDTVS